MTGRVEGSGSPVGFEFSITHSIHEAGLTGRGSWEEPRAGLRMLWLTINNLVQSHSA